MTEYRRPLGQRIPQFCENLGISVPLFYKLRQAQLRAGKPDPITKVGRSSIVTNEGEQSFLKSLAENQTEWRQRMAEEISRRATTADCPA